MVTFSSELLFLFYECFKISLDYLCFLDKKWSNCLQSNSMHVSIVTIALMFGSLHNDSKVNKLLHKRDKNTVGTYKT